MTITGAGGGLGERGAGVGVAVAKAGAGGGVPGFFSGLDWTLITSGVCWMRRVEPVSLTAAAAAARSPTATAASLAATTTGMAAGAGASGAATGAGSAECVEECKLAGAGVTGAGMGVGSLVEASVTVSKASVTGSGIGVGRGLGAASGVGLGAGSDAALITASETGAIGAGAGETAGVFDSFGGIAGICVAAFVFTDGAVGAAGGPVPPRGVSALPVVASVSCRSLITSRSFPLFLSALPVLPAPESTSSWAKLSMLSRILSSSAPSSSSPTTASLLPPWGGGGLWGVLEVGPFMARWLAGFWTWNWAILG